MTGTKRKVEAKKSTNNYPWSNSDLDFFKVLIIKKRKEALDEIECLRSQVVQDNRTDLDEDSEYSFHMADAASVATDREYIYRMIDRQERLVAYLDRALERIEMKTYGICRVTGKPITRERLEAIPHTELSVEGKMLEKQKGMIEKQEDDVDLIGL
ncbi:TraR/DksA C4-type zinc finger protein [bacterium]|nr:TraR/DksA C4-type zinc finger protein [bacterium]